ncbi:N-acetylmuramoyl-L-alanine amidase [Bacillus manliponensis]|uniref:N-acetylmuramoyl-L-alanine amidase n=1 Tax=Bacillus manliponensis TaxID=574376 RepID=UPI000691AD13|nr:N-acetylmuramoyl-L-alanine amidase [Bacillus manliponensis]
MTKRVWFDAGHGGYDPGALGYSLREKDIVLKLVLEAKRILLDEFYNVVVGMTRETDVFLSLEARADKANPWKADVFISFHCNSGSTNGVPGDGFETFRYPGANGDTLRLQQIMHNKIYNVYKQHSIDDRGMKQSNLSVLRRTHMAAVLTENLFMNNQEITKFNDVSFINAVARAHAEGVAEYLGLARKKPATSKQTMYRINIGDFDSIEWLAVALTKVKEVLPGYGVWTQCLDNGYHRIIVGDFNDKKWTDDTVEKLKPLGYGTWIQML